MIFFSGKCTASVRCVCSLWATKRTTWIEKQESKYSFKCTSHTMKNEDVTFTYTSEL